MKLAILAAFLMLLGLAGVMVTTILRVRENYTDEQIDYGVIMDAGSTSTKAYIYEWRHKVSAVLPQVTISLKDDKPLSYKVKPGIATLAPNYTNVGVYLDPIIEWAHDHIPKKRRQDTPIFLRGTGGLRQLSDVQSSALLYSVRTKLAESGFNFDNTQASILSLTQEAAYGFISANAIYNKFARIDDINVKPQLYGSLDMGGVSSEIAFVATGVLPPNTSYTIDLNATTFTIFAQALDRFGINEARYALNATLFLNSSNNYIVQSPCIPFGYYENVTITIGGSPRSFVLMGSSNADECKQVVQGLVRSMTANLPAVPPVGDTIFILADHYLIVKEFFKLKEHANLLELGAKASQFCQLSYGDALSRAKKRYSDVVQNFCFMGTYITTLLTEYYGVDQTMRHLIWKENVQNNPVTWSLGAILEHVSDLAPDMTPQAHERYIRYFHSDGGMVILFISILVFILGLVLFIVQRRRAADGYTAIQ